MKDSGIFPDVHTFNNVLSVMLRSVKAGGRIKSDRLKPSMNLVRLLFTERLKLLREKEFHNLLEINSVAGNIF